ncbi:hypothetical protein D477_017864 [Arthrobacter crystallopoietes BAB-32]|uniref:Uncharacterized protein n=1 Tax=Arthrobacter crystallopoietes BAB-32 TaxID=1246476 RepID=N1UYH1_9MICC|nr:DUF1801 domain-containing protein [Arthrobacter crystallopoietes]EMY32877.1 hypothetical protein D477_017864 [Arthrobacter crystallopoietes BAB-32]
MHRTDEAGEYLRQEFPEQAELALWLRSVLLEAEPDLEQRVYRGWQAVGFRHPDAGYVCGIFPRPEGLQLLFEHGASLPDPEGVLTAGGRQVRALPIADRSADTVDLVQRFLARSVIDGLERRAGRKPRSR